MQNEDKQVKILKRTTYCKCRSGLAADTQKESHSREAMVAFRSTEFAASTMAVAVTLILTVGERYQ